MNKPTLTLIAIGLLIIAAAYWYKVIYEQPGGVLSYNQMVQMDPLFDAIHNGKYSEVKKIVKEQPFILRQKNMQGGNYILCSVSSQDPQMLKLILKLGGDPNEMAANCGMRPLILACEMNSYFSAKILLDAKANPNVFGHSTCPLTAAKAHKNEKLINLLLAHGAKEISAPGRSSAAPQKAPEAKK